MSEIILNKTELPETLLKLISTEKVKIRELNGEIRISQINNNFNVNKFLAVKHAAAEAEDKITRLYEFCGSGADLNMTVDSFIAMTHDGSEL